MWKPRIILSPLWQKIAKIEAQRRFRGSDKPDRYHGRPIGQFTLDGEIDSTGAEIACGFAIGVIWHQKSWEEDKQGDLLPGQQVRQTQYSAGHLLLHPPKDGKTVRRGDDDPAHTFFLVTGRCPAYRIHGSILLARAMIIGVKKPLNADNRPCLTIRQDQLDPLIPPPRVDIKKIIFTPPASDYSIQTWLNF